ncbi:MAG TPA: hypothetical protein PLM53_19760 [Spirochaetota bacterium]|nr:hypothetical protein [Spirochaetota bacterium]HQF10432.1 hypothetical protein [Spirochaetota bacterium]HQH99331.1 hypothetical protein [Spirochaetota bacterium]HQJ73243.1 hypothetical protein [Spirochaetota bacterium]
MARDGGDAFCLLDLATVTCLLGVVDMSMPKGLSGSWFAAGMCGIVGQKGDIFDGIHYADGFRRGVAQMKAGPKPLAITCGANRLTHRHRGRMGPRIVLLSLLQKIPD